MQRDILYKKILFYINAIILILIYNTYKHNVSLNVLHKYEHISYNILYKIKISLF